MDNQHVSKTYGEDEIVKYANPDNWELWDSPTGYETLYQTFPEFTCLCPRSSYPDFARVHLVVVPSTKVLELKNLKMWLNSYRNKKISHENATFEILDTLVKKLDLAYGFILMEYTPRGNLTTFPMREFSNINYVAKSVDSELSVKNAIEIKNKIINHVMQRQLDR